jgi:hypothetical protein
MIEVEKWFGVVQSFPPSESDIEYIDFLLLEK